MRKNNDDDWTLQIKINIKSFDNKKHSKKVVEKKTEPKRWSADKFEGELITEPRHDLLSYFLQHFPFCIENTSTPACLSPFFVRNDAFMHQVKMDIQ